MGKFTAVWKPAWYALDQKIEQGMAAKFLFCDSEGRKQFFNGMGSGEGMESVHAKVTRIRNSVLGEIEEIDTYGLSYKIWLPENELVQVDAEQEPGKVENGSCQGFYLDDASCEVELEKLLPSEVGALEMLPVMINDEAHDFFKWAARDYDEITDMAAYMGSMIHYLVPRMKHGNDEIKIRQILLLIDKVFTENNPLTASVIDENVLRPLAMEDAAQAYMQMFFSETTRARVTIHKKRAEIMAMARK